MPRKIDIVVRGIALTVAGDAQCLPIAIFRPCRDLVAENRSVRCAIIELDPVGAAGLADVAAAASRTVITVLPQLDDGYLVIVHSLATARLARLGKTIPSYLDAAPGHWCDVIAKRLLLSAPQIDAEVIGVAPVLAD